MKKNHIIFVCLIITIQLSAHYETNRRPLHLHQSPEFNFSRSRAELHQDAQYALHNAVHDTYDAITNATQDTIQNTVGRHLLDTVESSIGSLAGKMYNTISGNSKPKPVSTSSTVSSNGFELPAPKKKTLPFSNRTKNTK